MQQGQMIDLEITDLADSGDGVGLYENIAVFVPDSVPGNRLEVNHTGLLRHFSLRIGRHTGECVTG